MSVTVNNPARVTVGRSMAALSIIEDGMARLAIVGNERIRNGQELDLGEHGVWQVVSSRASNGGLSCILTSVVPSDG